MTPPHDFQYPDSLEMLLKKAHAIQTVNQENIASIQARKGQQVILKHHYSLLAKQPSDAKDQKQHHHNLFQVINKTLTKNVDDIIAVWRYNGCPLMKEKIAIDDFIDRTLVEYSDLTRLNEDYFVLLDKYSRILSDEEESRIAVEIVMRNMELLQVAIGEIHEQVLDDADPDEISDAMASLVMDLSKVLSSFQSKVSGVRFNLDFKGNVEEDMKDKGVVCFHNCKTLTCKFTLSEHKARIWAVHPYVWNNEQYLASASADNTIKLWELSSNKLVTTLSSHSAYVSALAMYVHDGVQMLASGSADETIKLWNLSNNNIYKTLLGHGNGIVSLTVYEKNYETILVSGSHDKMIKLWDVNNGTAIETLQGHEKSVEALSVYKYDDNYFLASGSADRSIKIWNLDNYTLVRTLQEDVGCVCALVAVNCDGKHLLASGDNRGIIKLWNVGNFHCVGTIDAHSKFIRCLQIVDCYGKMCLVSCSDDKTIKVLDIQNSTVLKTLNNNTDINTISVFMNGDHACLASGDDANNIKLWMEPT